METSAKIPCPSCFAGEHKNPEGCKYCNDTGLAHVRRALLLDDERVPFQVVVHPELFRWTVCRTNKEAVAAVDNNEPFDVWFLDYQLVGDTTRDFIWEMRARPSALPNEIVIVSDHPERTKLYNWCLSLTRHAKVSVLMKHQPPVVKTWVFAYVDNTQMTGQVEESSKLRRGQWNHQPGWAKKAHRGR